MKRTVQVCTFVALLTLSLSAFTQERPRRPENDDLVSPKTMVQNLAAVTYNGTLVYNFTVLTTSPIIDPVYCSVSVYVSGDSSGRTYSESAYGRATAISGGYAKCTVKIYYSWLLASAGTDMVTGSYSISGSTAAVSGTTQRSVNSNVTSFAVPATGVTTTTAISGRL